MENSKKYGVLQKDLTLLSSNTEKTWVYMSDWSITTFIAGSTLAGCSPACTIQEKWNSNHFCFSHNFRAHPKYCIIKQIPTIWPFLYNFCSRNRQSDRQLIPVYFLILLVGEKNPLSYLLKFFRTTASQLINYTFISQKIISILFSPPRVNN